MRKSRLLGAACACISVFTAPQAMSVTIDAYFGWNFVGANITDLGGNPIALPELALDSITYFGASGTITQDMNYGGLGGSMPDGTGLATKPTSTYDIGTKLGDGESTRTVGTSLPIDWYAANASTPWGTNPFPTIGITGISAFGVGGSLTSSVTYIVGLILDGANTELDSSGLDTLQSDIYESSRQTFFSADPGFGIIGDGVFIFSAAAVSPVPVPAAVWLFGSGLLGLIGIARRKKA